MIWSHLLKKSLMEKFIFCAVFSTKVLLLKFGIFFRTVSLGSPFGGVSSGSFCDGKTC